MRRPYLGSATLFGAALVASSLLALGEPAISFASGAPVLPRATLPGALGVPQLPLPGESGVLRVPKPGTASQLTAVACTSAGNCWAVGAYASNGASLNQVLHWNGAKWSKATVPNPGGTASGDISELNAVRCNVPTDCWAVGDYDHAGAELNEALHWNGAKWTLIATPDPAGKTSADVNSLSEAWCTSAGNCWAVGIKAQYNGPYEVGFNQALHWNGAKWSAVAVPSPGGTAANDVSNLRSVRCTSASNCWAVGYYGNTAASLLLNEALHWNGVKWSRVTTPDPGGAAADDFSELLSISCASAGNCWAAGAYGAVGAQFTSLNQILHWNGKHWSQANAPDPDGAGGGASNRLLSATCTSASNCWAVGDYGSITGSVGVVLNQALHWNGANWSLVSTPDPAGTADGDRNTLTGVRCVSAGNCWAVGTQLPGQFDLNEALHWNGSAWSTR